MPEAASIAQRRGVHCDGTVGEIGSAAFPEKSRILEGFGRMPLERNGWFCHDHRSARLTARSSREHPMDRSSKAIKLALIGTASVALLGSAFLVSGCQQRTGMANQVGGRGGFFFIPRLGSWGGGGGGGGVATSPSSRGGFGSTGSSAIGS
jgi:hypothetical protein